jgi:hypothetical protein
VQPCRHSTQIRQCTHHAAIGGVVEDFLRPRCIGKSRAPMALGSKSDEIYRVIAQGMPAYVLIAPI